MAENKHAEPAIILLVEDNPGDADLTLEAMKDAKLINTMYHVMDGVEAMAFLRKKGKYQNMPRPNLILLDLNMPRKDGRETLAEIKSDPALRRIPVVVLTVSDNEQDILQSYDLHANCYVKKPLNFDEFTKAMQRIEDFWFCIVRLPPNGKGRTNDN
jgi:two-component system, chemotaxis family, response regulator Rcp1